MKQPDRNPKFRHSFFAGLLLVPLLHIAFTIVWVIISIGLTVAFPFFNTSYNGLFLLYPIFALGLTQAAYLLPAYFLFAKKRRTEVCKGIIAGAFVTFLVSGTCATGLFGFLSFGLYGKIIVPIALGSLGVGAIGVWLVGRSAS
jgi:hypothetical protein